MDSSSEQFSRIYDQYIEKIYRFVFLKVNSQEVAEDIVSKVFLKGWEYYQKQEDSLENPGAFLYTLARNSVVDFYRERGRTKVVSSEAIGQITDNSRMQDAILASAEVQALKGAIAKLKKEYQDVIIWHYLEDMSTKEIASLLNKTEGNVRVSLHRGLKELKGLVQEA